jgi:hypothetical protein
VYRQLKGSPFLQFLTICRFRPPTAQEINGVLAHTFLPEEQLQANFREDTRIVCSHVEDVMQHNYDYLHWASNRGLVGPVAATGLVTNAGDVLDLYKWTEDPKDNKLPFIAKGARVMFTENINKPKGMINSATATITDFEQDEQGTVVKITVTVDSTGSTETVARGAGRGTTITTYLMGIEYTKKVFPLRLAYAMTAHRCQGMTLRGHTVLHLRNAFAAGIAYVMLSRVPNADNLQILGGLRPEDITPVPLTGW